MMKSFGVNGKMRIFRSHSRDIHKCHNPVCYNFFVRIGNFSSKQYCSKSCQDFFTRLRQGYYQKQFSRWIHLKQVYVNLPNLKVEDLLTTKELKDIREENRI